MAKKEDIEEAIAAALVHLSKVSSFGFSLRDLPEFLEPRLLECGCSEEACEHAISVLIQPASARTTALAHV